MSIAADPGSAVLEQEGRFLVNESVYHDPDILRLEMERIRSQRRGRPGPGP